MTKSLNGSNGSNESNGSNGSNGSYGASASLLAGEAERTYGRAHVPRNPPRTNATKPVRRSSRHRLDPKLERGAWLEIEALLSGSHRRIEQLFARAAKLQSKDADGLAQAFERIGDALQAHFELKTEVVYPPLYESLTDAGPILEAEVELDLAQGLLDRVAALQPHDEMYQPIINILGAWIQRHLELERSRLFPLARRAMPSFAGRIADVRARFEAEALALADTLAGPSPGKSSAAAAGHAATTTGGRKSRKKSVAQSRGTRMKSQPAGRAGVAPRSHR